jgi:hypothetical protein
LEDQSGERIRVHGEVRDDSGAGAEVGDVGRGGVVGYAEPDRNDRSWKVGGYRGGARGSAGGCDGFGEGGFCDEGWGGVQEAVRARFQVEFRVFSLLLSTVGMV